MKFFYITDNRNSGVDALFKEVCLNNNIEYYELRPQEFDFTNRISVDKGDLLYRTSMTNNARMLEDYLLEFYPFLTTFYSTTENRKNAISPIIFEKHKLPTPKTLYKMTYDKEVLEKDVEYLGGFPLIVKLIGETGGLGIIKIDSFEGLLSLSEYLIKLKKEYILREYIEHDVYARLIVIGKQVVASKQNLIPKNDFRSNNGEPIPRKFPSEIESLAVKSVEVLSREFGGVDIIIDKEGKPFLTEVNIPCHFYSTQKTTGVNIADLMVKYLISKSEQS